MDLPEFALVGHSFGGWIVLSCARTYGESLGGVITVDAAVVEKSVFLSLPAPTAAQLEKKRGDPAGREVTRVKMEQRFRLLPPQDCVNAWLLQYTAHHSVRECAGGWEFKIDPERCWRTATILDLNICVGVGGLRGPMCTGLWDKDRDCRCSHTSFPAPVISHAVPLGPLRESRVDVESAPRASVPCIAEPVSSMQRLKRSSRPRG